MSRVAAQRELTARYRYALTAYRALPWPCQIDERRYCNQVVEAMGSITWADSGTRSAVGLDAGEAYRAAKEQYDAGV